MRLGFFFSAVVLVGTFITFAVAGPNVRGPLSLPKEVRLRTARTRLHRKLMTKVSAVERANTLVRLIGSTTTPSNLTIDTSGVTPLIRPVEPPAVETSWAIPSLPWEHHPSHDKCRFESCPGDQPFIYFFTPHRNRAASYNRLVRSLAYDVVVDAPVDPRCVCLLVADFVDQQNRPFVTDALEDWPLDYQVIEMHGKFSPAFAFQESIRAAVVNNTSPSESILIRVDADIIAFPGLTRAILRNVREGEYGVAPVVWSTLDKENEMQGWWRSGGTGMVGFYHSDLLRCTEGTMPFADREAWGKEDSALFNSLDYCPSFAMRRLCTRQMFHLWHPKASWTKSADGFLKTKGATPEEFNPFDWKLPMPPRSAPDLLMWMGVTLDDRCTQLSAGVRFPAALIPHRAGKWDRYGMQRILDEEMRNVEVAQLKRMGVDPMLLNSLPPLLEDRTVPIPEDDVVIDLIDQPV